MPYARADLGDALGAGDLDDEALVLAHQVQQGGEVRVVLGGTRHIGRAHMINHHIGRDRGEQGDQAVDVVALEIDHQMPAELGHAAGHIAIDLMGHLVGQARHEVETAGLDAGLVQFGQFAVGDVRIDHRHAPGLIVRMDQGVHQGAVVRAVATGLHDHIALEAQKVAQGEQLFLGGVAGGVLAAGMIGKHVARAEHVAVRVHRALGRDEGRLGWIGHKRQIVGIHPGDS